MSFCALYKNRNGGTLCFNFRFIEYLNVGDVQSYLKCICFPALCIFILCYSLLVGDKILHLSKIRLSADEKIDTKHKV